MNIRYEIMSKNYHVICLALAVLMVSACSFQNYVGLKDSPNSTNSVYPKSGHWVGENKEPGEASVSFDLSKSGKITNFILTAFVGTPVSSCEITIEQAQLEVDKENGTFVISYLMEYEELEKQLGKAVMSLGAIPKGKPYEVLRIEGSVTETMLTGTYTIHVCGPVLYFQPQTGAWNPQWKQP